MSATIGHNGFIEPASWAWACAQSKAHAYVKLIVHTIRCLVNEGEQEASISDSRLADLTSLEIKTVRKYRKIVNDTGWAEHHPGRSKTKPSTYRLNIPTKTILELSTAVNEANRTHETGTVGRSLSDTSVPTRRVQSRGAVELDGNRVEGTVKKEIPPTPPKEKNNNIYNNHHSIETATARGGGQDLPGLNGSTSVVIEKLAGWIRPGMPDYVTARASLENMVGIYPPEIVRDSFAHLEAKMLSGDIVPSPLKYFIGTCRGMNSEAEKERKKDKKPPGMSEKIWKRIQEDEAKARANGGISLW